MKPERRLPPGSDSIAFLKSLKSTAARRLALARLDESQREALDRAWQRWAHVGQLAPPGEWSTWVIKAGRGFGKTRAGAEWIAARIAAEDDGGEALRIALVGATLEDARRVMVEGKSGLLEVAGHWIAEWHASLGRLRFTTGAEAQLFSGHPALAARPRAPLRVVRRAAKWDKPQETWDMLQLGLRLGGNPRAIVTTTPRSGPVLGAIMDQPGTVVTGGPTYANPHLPPAWKRRVERLYAGTRLGRQELDGEYLPDAAGDRAIAHVLADHSVTARSPEGWASAAAAAAAAHGTIEVVAEANQGGRMVKAVFHAAERSLRVRLVTAHTGKTARDPSWGLVHCHGNAMASICGAVYSVSCPELIRCELPGITECTGKRS